MSELFKSESPQPPAVKMICGNCVHYRPHVDQFTKRVHPTKRGRCGWKAEIDWPMAFKQTFGGTCYDPRLSSEPVRKTTNAKECKCFTAKK